MNKAGQGQNHSSNNRVLRGYNYNTNSDNWYTGNRSNNNPTNSNDNYGSRVGSNTKSEYIF